MNHLKTIGMVLALGIFTNILRAQDAGIESMLDSLVAPQTQYTYGTFKSTRVLNGHSNERMPQGQLDFRIEHRFGHMSQGYYELFGLDQASNFLGLEYGITDWVMVGFNRTSLDKTLSGFTKFSITRQSRGIRNMPVSVSLLAGTSVVGTRWTYPERDNLFTSRISYSTQLIMARKFSESLSLQVAPVWIHRNMVPKVADRNDMFALGLAGRYKLTRRVSFNAEYYPVLSPSWNHSNTSYTNSLSFGFDIETGGHVFQLLVTNSEGMNEKTFITESTGNWSKGDVRLGFNISRVFSFK